MIVSWNTTNACNLKCAHCYRDAGAKAADELSTAEAKKMLGEIARAGFKIMIFSGGEPLMRSDILELVEFAASQGMRPVFGTNGTLITPEMARALNAAGTMGVGISPVSLATAKQERLRGEAGALEGGAGGMEKCRAAHLSSLVPPTGMAW